MHEEIISCSKRTCSKKTCSQESIHKGSIQCLSHTKPGRSAEQRHPLALNGESASISCQYCTIHFLIYYHHSMQASICLLQANVRSPSGIAGSGGGAPSMQHLQVQVAFKGLLVRNDSVRKLALPDG